MKSILIFVLLFSYLTLLGQNKKEIKTQFKQVSSIEDALKLQEKQPDWDVEIYEVNSNDSTFEKSLRDLQIGETLKIKEPTKIIYYKAIEENTALEFRVSYIFFDGNRLEVTQIDSLRDLVIKQLSNGVPFSELHKKYNMDRNPSNGDLGWFKEGDMVSEFENAVRDHKVDEVFKIDIPENQWYYVTLKTFENKKTRTLTTIKLEVSTE
ncbi:MAG: hypothetical protein CMO01_10575 [Thalassobius sp.]|nr:hypothetical protein [Thalassovita sp.]